MLKLVRYIKPLSETKEPATSNRRKRQNDCNSVKMHESCTCIKLIAFMTSDGANSQNWLF